MRTLGRDQKALAQLMNRSPNRDALVLVKCPVR